MNNIALFVTHSIFLTEDQVASLVEGTAVETMGHCVPVGIDAKTGKTTEPANEVFCHYRLNNCEETQREVKIIPKKGYEVFLPKSSGWVGPPPDDFEKMAVWPSEERMNFFREMEKWWFSNPKPPDSNDLKKGYLRFEIRNAKEKSHAEQHVVEISLWKRLVDSLAT